MTGLLARAADKRDGAVAAIVERCEGNPFYAEQSVQLLTDTAPERPLPESVQAVIAARLDALPPDQKAVLCDAAVVGSVFWDGALAAMDGRDEREVDSLLSGLPEHQLIRRIRESSLEGAREFAFVHALARDVAYGQLPRRIRAKKHATIAGWLEAVAPEREDIPLELVAHHYLRAFELAEAASHSEAREAFREHATASLARAAERIARLDIIEAQRLFQRALDIAPPDHPSLPRLLFGLGDARLQSGEMTAAISSLQEAVRAADDLDNAEVSVLARIKLNQALTYGEGYPHLELVDEALEIAERLGRPRRSSRPSRRGRSGRLPGRPRAGPK